MTEFLIIKNAYKSPVKTIFDYLEVESLRNQNSKQSLMLKSICDGVLFFKEEMVSEAKKRLNKGDYLYEISPSGKDKYLICIDPK